MVKIHLTDETKKKAEIEILIKFFWNKRVGQEELKCEKEKWG